MAGMFSESTEHMVELFNTLYKPHPWHGVSPGSVDELPNTVRCFIESVPGDAVKYEVDKPSGYMIVDRPHKYSSMCPTLYGFVPQTYCGARVAHRAMERNPQITDIVGDGDPLDICVLSSRPLVHGNVMVHCRPIGGFRMIDNGEADDKIIAVIIADPAWGHWTNISDLPAPLLDMLKHYFLTYKEKPDSDKSAPSPVVIPEVYDADEARHVLSLSLFDYVEKYGKMKHTFFAALAHMLSGAVASCHAQAAACAHGHTSSVVDEVESVAAAAAAGLGDPTPHRGIAPCAASTPLRVPMNSPPVVAAAGPMTSVFGGRINTVAENIAATQHLASYYYALARANEMNAAPTASPTGAAALPPAAVPLGTPLVAPAASPIVAATSTAADADMESAHKR